MFRLNKNYSKYIINIQKRYAGGFLRKNMAVEENAGIREASYKTWKFTGSNMISMGLLLFLPGYLFYVFTIQENKNKDAQVGRNREYGVIPSKAWRS